MLLSDISGEFPKPSATLFFFNNLLGPSIYRRRATIHTSARLRSWHRIRLDGT